MAYQPSHYNPYTLPGSQHSSQLATGTQNHGLHYHQPAPQPYPSHQTASASTSTLSLPQYNTQTTQSLPSHLHPSSAHQLDATSSPGPHSSALTSTSSSPVPHSTGNTSPPGQAQYPPQESSLLISEEDLVISTLWVDNLSKDLKLEPSQRKQMRDFVKVRHSISHEHLLSYLHYHRIILPFNSSHRCQMT